MIVYQDSLHFDGETFMHLKASGGRFSHCVAKGISFIYGNNSATIPIALQTMLEAD
jgi:hypothetical protein